MISTNSRPYFALGAAAGAQHAAQTDLLAAKKETSTDLGKREIAAHAKGSLPSWAIGLRRDNMLFRPAVGQSSVATAPADGDRMDMVDPPTTIFQPNLFFTT
jgi:hypothetical protein